MRTERDTELLAAPFPEVWLTYLRNNVGLYASLTEAEQTRLRDDLRVFVAERTWVAEEDGAMVATARDFPTDMTVPGGAELGVAALTAVTVHPTHRRRGLLRELMDRHVGGARERGEPLGALIASEHPIYGRFGYGPATERVTGALAHPLAVLRAPDAPPGSVALLGPEDAARWLPEVHERAPLRIACAVKLLGFEVDILDHRTLAVQETVGCRTRPRPRCR